MFAKVAREVFSTAFQVAKSAIPGRTPTDIRKNVLMTLKGGEARLTAGTNEILVTQVIPDVDGEDGSALIRANMMADILGTLTDERMELRRDGDRLVIDCGLAHFELNMQDPDEYPAVKDPGSPVWTFQVSKGGLIMAIRRTAFATDVESTRYALGGILFAPVEYGIEMAATDSRRLSVVGIDAEAVVEHPKQFSPVVPGVAAKMVASAISSLEVDDVVIAFRTNAVEFTAGGFRMIANLVEGRFPRYQDVIPKSPVGGMEVDPKDLLRMTRQASIMCDDESRGVDYEFGDVVTVTASVREQGGAKVEKELGGLFGSNVDGKFAIDGRYMAEFLKCVEHENTVRIEWTDSETAILMTVGRTRHIMMPLSRER